MITALLTSVWFWVMLTVCPPAALGLLTGTWLCSFSLVAWLLMDWAFITMMCIVATAVVFFIIKDQMEK